MCKRAERPHIDCFVVGGVDVERVDAVDLEVITLLRDIVLSNILIKNVSLPVVLQVKSSYSSRFMYSWIHGLSDSWTPPPAGILPPPFPGLVPSQGR